MSLYWMKAALASCFLFFFLCLPLCLTGSPEHYLFSFDVVLLFPFFFFFFCSLFCFVLWFVLFCFLFCFCFFNRRFDFVWIVLWLYLSSLWNLTNVNPRTKLPLVCVTVCVANKTLAHTQTFAQNILYASAGCVVTDRVVGNRLERALRGNKANLGGFIFATKFVLSNLSDIIWVIYYISSSILVQVRHVGL